MKLVDTKPKTYIIELTESEIFELVHRLKFIDREHNAYPDLSAKTWKSLEELIGTVKYRIDFY
jgi:hypothetical protein